MKKIKQFHLFGVITILTFCEWFFFRNIIGNDSLIGSIVDGRYTNLTVEHWFQFFCGHEGFKELPMFYPFEGTLGYSDMLFGHGLLYCILRFLGINIYDAYKWTLIFVHLIGTYTAYYLFNKKIHTSTLLSLFGTITFSFSQSYAYHLRHTQLMALSYLPLLLICIISLLENFDNRRKRNIYTYLTILMFSFIIYTSWYTAFFFALFSAVFGVIFAVLMPHKLSVINKIVSILKDIKFDIIGYIIFMAAILLPFIYVYMPILKEKGGYSYDYIIAQLPEPVDIINVPKHNLALGTWVYNTLHLTDRGFSIELIEGFSPILLFLLGAGLILPRKRTNTTSIKKIIEQTCCASISPAILVCILFTLKLSSNGISLWYLIYKFIPAGQSIRVPARFFLFLQFPMTIAATIYCNELIKKVKFKTIILCALIFISFFFNISLHGVSSFWNKSERISAMQGVSVPPEECIAFYLIDTVNQIENTGQFQADAFEIATLYRLPTINGISGQIPEGWGAINNPRDSAAYEQAVFALINDKNLQGIYAYDLGADKWISIEDRKKATHK